MNGLTNLVTDYSGWLMNVDCSDIDWKNGLTDQSVLIEQRMDWSVLLTDEWITQFVTDIVINLIDL